MIKNIRVLILLYILLMVAVAGWLAKARSTDWDKPLNVVVYASMVMVVQPVKAISINCKTAILTILKYFLSAKQNVINLS